MTLVTIVIQQQLCDILGNRDLFGVIFLDMTHIFFTGHLRFFDQYLEVMPAGFIPNGISTILNEIQTDKNLNYSLIKSESIYSLLSKILFKCNVCKETLDLTPVLYTIGL